MQELSAASSTLHVNIIINHHYQSSQSKSSHNRDSTSYRTPHFTVQSDIILFSSTNSSADDSVGTQSSTSQSIYGHEKLLAPVCP